jgi:hypothetical protein
MTNTFFKGKFSILNACSLDLALPHVHSTSEKWISHVSHRKFCNVFHGYLVVNSTIKLKRIKRSRLQLLLLSWYAALSRLDPATRNIAISRLQAGESQIEVARTLNINQSTISRLWNRFQQTGSTNDRQRSGRPRIATPGQYRYIRVFHLWNRTTVAASTTAAGIPGFRRISSQTVHNGFDSMALDPGGRNLERYWRCYRDMKESVGATY